jgi:hypothetical protein
MKIYPEAIGEKKKRKVFEQPNFSDVSKSYFHCDARKGEKWEHFIDGRNFHSGPSAT